MTILTNFLLAPPTTPSGTPVTPPAPALPGKPTYVFHKTMCLEILCRNIFIELKLFNLAFLNVNLSLSNKFNAGIKYSEQIDYLFYLTHF